MQIAIPSYLPFPISPFDIYCTILIAKSENCAANELEKKKKSYYFKGLHKTTCYKTKSIFSQFFFSHLPLHEWFFFFPYQIVCKFWKIDKISSYMTMEKNWKYWNMEILCQKIIVSNIILAFLDDLKPKMFFFMKPWWSTYSAASPHHPFPNIWIHACTWWTVAKIIDGCVYYIFY